MSIPFFRFDLAVLRFVILYEVADEHKNLAIVGSRKIKEILIDDYIPKGVTEIVLGGAKGIDLLAREYAMKKG